MNKLIYFSKKKNIYIYIMGLDYKKKYLKYKNKYLEAKKIYGGTGAETIPRYHAIYPVEINKNTYNDNTGTHTRFEFPNTDDEDITTTHFKYTEEEEKMMNSPINTMKGVEKAAGEEAKAAGEEAKAAGEEAKAAGEEAKAAGEEAKAAGKKDSLEDQKKG